MKVALSGCFDAFHEGHRHLLAAAYYYASHNKPSDEGDNEIIIALNSDESIRNLKGKDRPYDTLANRKRIIEKEFSKFKEVSVRVIDFTEESSLDMLYKVSQPDFILHGNDITDPTKIVGADKFPVILVPRISKANGEELSTTAILRKKRHGKTNS